MTRLILVVSILSAAGCFNDDAPYHPPAAETIPDALTGPCTVCAADQQCVASYDGRCDVTIACIAREIVCRDDVCSSACEAAYCRAPYQCEDRAVCPDAVEGAFTCYGP